ncbi:hypothetical protein IHC87_21330 (plasmid) [Photobacterium damselae subsp. damselae]|uniref:hypothetical protein n=1 Tax=Photobacterium damselae TaxID=38293 RepID=UPI001F38ADC0|nr:hypothetical protein [Photobacterium damselae]UJZ96551.1 hypothetical protein IHC87_21330 [Photobacterium damselae subsp. damselae]UKA00510.1 hypothetical protein IHC88_21235 [Photobacterium damselae subsp. damselae]
MQIQLGDTVRETIQITAIRKTKIEPAWYTSVNQTLISLGYQQIKRRFWVGKFVFDREEKFSVRTPAERALHKALNIAGAIPLKITLQLGEFQTYHLDTETLMEPYSPFQSPRYLARLIRQEPIHTQPVKEKVELSDIDVYQVACLYRKGLEVSEIAKELGATKDQIYTLLNDEVFNF